jgi:hypothetical protein
MKKACLTLTLAVILLTIGSCIGIQDGSEPSAASPTLGQELIDLMKARDAGAVTQKEYRDLKSMLVEQYE